MYSRCIQDVLKVYLRCTQGVVKMYLYFMKIQVKTYRYYRKKTIFLNFDLTRSYTSVVILLRFFEILHFRDFAFSRFSQAVSLAIAIAEAIGEAAIDRRYFDAHRSRNNVAHCKKTINI